MKSFYPVGDIVYSVDMLLDFFFGFWGYLIGPII